MSDFDAIQENLNDKTRIYACGGCATNLVNQSDVIQRDDVEVCFIDTSRSNLTDQQDDDNTYLLEGLSGSGGRRRQNSQPIKDALPTILTRFPPGNFNIVVSSASGGSGSVISPMLISKLLSQDLTTVLILVGSTESNVALENTINTLKSMEGVSATTQRSIPMAYLENTTGIPRDDVDDQADYILSCLVTLGDDHLRELDRADRYHWGQFQNVTALEPQLATLNVATSRQEATQIMDPISIASIYQSPQHYRPFGDPHFATVGYAYAGGMLEFDQLHFVINLYDLEEITRGLQDRHQQVSRHLSQQKRRQTLINVDDDEFNEDGLVL